MSSKLPKITHIIVNTVARIDYMLTFTIWAVSTASVAMALMDLAGSGGEPLQSSIWNSYIHISEAAAHQPITLLAIVICILFSTACIVGLLYVVPNLLSVILKQVFNINKRTPMFTFITLKYIIVSINFVILIITAPHNSSLMKLFGYITLAALICIWIEYLLAKKYRIPVKDLL